MICTAKFSITSLAATRLKADFLKLNGTGGKQEHNVC